MKKNILKYTLSAIFALAYTLPAFAQDGPGGDGADEEDPLPAPIDNWMILLAIAAIAVGVYYINKQNKSIA